VVLAGDLSPRRDFTDVRDVVRAYRLLVLRGEPGEVYNVCSGVDVAVSEVAEHLIGRADRPMRIELDPERLRPVELPVLRGDCSKLGEATGWTPEIPLTSTLDDLLDWWRERVASGD
jgi:GDP-4-dehydro-6-deoxy-D-mannose reductase